MEGKFDTHVVFQRQDDGVVIIRDPRSSSPTGKPGITVLPNGHYVSRRSDFIVYSVEAEFIDRVVAEYGPCRCSISVSSVPSHTPSFQLHLLLLS